VATDDRQVLVVGQASAPANYRIPGSGQIRPKVVFAKFDGTNAVTGYVPALKVTSDGGKTVGIFPAFSTVAAGGSVNVSWFPDVVPDDDSNVTPSSSGTISTLTSTAATIAVTNPTGPATNVDLPTTGVAAGTYGDSSHVSQVTVDVEGRVTAASSVAFGSGSITGPDGWVADGNSPTFATATTFTAGASDLTAVYSPGTRIKLTQTTPKFFVVAKSAFGAGTTTVTITGGTDYTLANAAITSPFYSYVVNPQGWPSWFNYTATVTGFTGAVTQSLRFAVVGRTVWFNVINVSGTSNATGFTISLPITAVNNSAAAISVTSAGVSQGAPGRLDIVVGTDATVCNVRLDFKATSFSNSLTKACGAGVGVTFGYEI
jgi:hypothetical protein